MDKRLRIILELVASGFSNGARGATNIFKGFVGTITDGALNASRAIMSLTQAIFFAREALNTLVRAGQWLFDTFVRGAGDAAKLEAKLKNVTGSAESAEQVMDLLRQTAADTGADFDELAAGASLLAVAAKDASGNFDINKFQRLQNMLQRMAALRPDVPIDRLARGLSTAVQTGNWQSLEMFLDVNLRQLIGLADAAEEVSKIPDQIGQGVTYISTKAGEAAKDALKDLDLIDEALTKAGATAGLIQDVAELSGLERFQQILGQIADTIGEPLFEAFNEELSKLADWLQENPEKVEEFANILGTTLAEAFEVLAGLAEDVDWDKVVESILEMARGLEDIGQVFAQISNFIDSVKAVENWLNQAGESVTQSGQRTGEALGTRGILPGLEKAAQKILLDIHVTSDNDMFDAKVKQIADDSTTEGMNMLADEMEGQP